MNATREQTALQGPATQIDFEYDIKEGDVILDLWSDRPLSELQLAVVAREAVRGPLEPKYVTQHVTFQNGYVYILAWDSRDHSLDHRCKQLIRHILDAHR
jgi:hypothetical protein